MLILVYLSVIGTWILPVQGIVKQFNSTILSERIVHYPNDYLSLEISGEGEDSVLYMKIDREINEATDITLKLQVKRGNRVTLVPMLDQAKLCALLWNEIHEPNGIQARYKMSQAFNLDGFECPIRKRSVRLVPWILTRQHTFEAEFPCGDYHYELSLEQCRPFSRCKTFMVADVEVRMTAENCYY